MKIDLTNKEIMALNKIRKTENNNAVEETKKDKDGDECSFKLSLDIAFTKTSDDDD